MTLSPDAGGVFDTLLRLVRRGLGGRAGDGRQYVSWIHEADFVSAVRWLIEDHDVEGVVNVAAPHPVPNASSCACCARLRASGSGCRRADDARARRALHADRDRAHLQEPPRRVGRLLDGGFEFKYPHWSGAARELCRRWTAGALLERAGEQVADARPT
jgi:hypothetical protein